MTPRQPIETNPEIQTLREQLESWRQALNGKRKTIPQQYWKSAARFAKKYTIAQVAKYLRLNYRDLQKRMNASSPQKQNKKISKSSFVELDLTGSSSQECILEMEDNRGAKMKIQLKGHHNLDLAGLSRAFWGKQ